MRTSALFDSNASDFSKVVMCTHGQGWLSQCEHFADIRGSIFHDFVPTSFMDGPYFSLNSNSNQQIDYTEYTTAGFHHLDGRAVK